MKKLVLLVFAFLSFSGIWAQTSNMVIFTEEGERFYAILNGLKMNEAPVTNLKVEDLNQPGYKLKLIFENTALGEIDKNIYFQEQGVEVVFMVAKNKKGEYKVRFRSQTPLNQAPPAPANQQVVVFGAPAGGVVVEETFSTTTTTDNVSMNMGTNMNVGTTYEETTVTTTTTSSPGTTESVNMNVGIDGFGMNVNVTASDGMGNSSMTTTTTTTTTTSGTGGGMVVVEEPAPCPAMGPGDFDNACNSIRSKSFEDSKLTLAKQIVRGHCVSSGQVRDMCKLFDFEDTKLEFAKYAFDFTLDQNQYYMVNDAFTFESSIEELDEYIQSRR